MRVPPLCNVPNMYRENVAFLFELVKIEITRRVEIPLDERIVHAVGDKDGEHLIPAPEDASALKIDVAFIL